MGRAAAPGPLPPAHEPRPLRAPGPRGCAPGRAGLAPCRGRSAPRLLRRLLPLRAAAAGAPKPAAPPADPHAGRRSGARAGRWTHGGRWAELSGKSWRRAGAGASGTREAAWTWEGQAGRSGPASSHSDHQHALGPPVLLLLGLYSLGLRDLTLCPCSLYTDHDLPQTTSRA